MFLAFTVGYYLYGKSAGFTKMCTVWNVIVTSLCLIPAYFGGSASVASMWEIQLVFQVPVTLIGLYLEVVGSTGKWAIQFPFGCGLNVDTYNFVNLCFYV